MHRDHGQFQDQRPDGQQHEAQQEIDALHPAFDDAGEAAGLAGDVVAQRKLVDMGEGLDRQAADRALADADEDRIAQFAEDHRAKAGEAVGDDKADRAEAQISAGDRARLARQVVDGQLVDVGRRDRDELGQQQEEEAPGPRGASPRPARRARDRGRPGGAWSARARGRCPGRQRWRSWWCGASGFLGACPGRPTGLRGGSGSAMVNSRFLE
jgi:hypothetical protein